jgi:hypothetical protein
MIALRPALARRAMRRLPLAVLLTACGLAASPAAPARQAGATEFADADAHGDGHNLPPGLEP